MEKLTAKASIGIQKSVAEIFEAIVNPEVMKNYFISEGSGRMEAGKDLTWSFPEFDSAYPLTVQEIILNEKIVFRWDKNAVTTIELQMISEDDSVVKISEEGHQNNENGVKWAIGQTEGWANFLACLKAWLEYGIHLRKGAFSFLNAN